MSSSPASRGMAGEEGWENQSPDPHLQELRQILLGDQLLRLQELERRLADPKLRTEELSNIVAEAIALRARRDREVQRTLHPLVEEALRISVERNPKVLANAMYPIIGEAVRKAVAHALRGMVESMNQLLERSVSVESVKWRLEAARTGKSFGEVALMRSLRYRVEQVFLIHRETGLLLQHVAASQQVVQDTDLVSGMLTAVQDFVRDSFGARKSEDLETMQVGEYTVWIQHGPTALLAGVVSGTPPAQLRNVFQGALEQVHQKFSSELEAFRGDAGPLAGTRPIVQTCLLGKSVIEKTKSNRLAWVVALVLVPVVALAGYLWWQERKWSQFIERLRVEPGIVVTSVESGWRNRSLAGLRDPMARDPGELLHAAGIDPERVSFEWRPYASEEPAFAATRWLASQKELIEQQVVRFAENSARIEPTEQVKLDLLEVRIAELDAWAKSRGQQVLVQVYGHADSQGREDANEQLSRQRADEVVAALVARGINAGNFSPQGKGTRSPGERDGQRYRDDLNRRVTFRVVQPVAGKLR